MRTTNMQSAVSEYHPHPHQKKKKEKKMLTVSFQYTCWVRFREYHPRLLMKIIPFDREVYTGSLCSTV